MGWDPDGWGHSDFLIQPFYRVYDWYETFWERI